MLVPLNPDVVVVNGTIDKMNTIYTFIVDKDAGKAILLPSNRGCVGFTSEDGLPICQSCRHYSDTRFGRYSVVSVYDLDGKLVKEMSFEDYKKMRSNDIFNRRESSFGIGESCISCLVSLSIILVVRSLIPMSSTKFSVSKM